MNAIPKIVGYWLLLTWIISCSTNKSISDQEIASLEQALNHIDNYQGKAEDFTLRVPLQKRLTDRGFAIPQALAWTIIDHKIRKKGWMPNGHEDKNGFRVYGYKDLR
jgi:hypothetical protein